MLFLAVFDNVVLVGVADGVHHLEIDAPADEVGAAYAFGCELLGAFFEDIRAERYLVEGLAGITLAAEGGVVAFVELVDGCDCLGCRAVVDLVGCLGVDQESLGIAHEWPVEVGAFAGRGGSALRDVVYNVFATSDRMRP